MKPKETIRYSEAFKQQVISELETGKFPGPFKAGEAYGICCGTVQGWLHKYGRSDLVRRKVTITTMTEQDENKALKKRVRELERALSDTHMKELVGEAYLKIACKRLGMEMEEFKKKAATMPSAKPTDNPPCDR